MSAPALVLDSFAILAVLEDDAGAQQVVDLLLAETGALYLSAINLGEVYYVVARRHGEPAADQVIRAIHQEERLTIMDATWPRIKAAARLKAAGGLSYADAFGLALAQELSASLVTGDPELRQAAAKHGIPLVWLGQSGD